MLGILFLETDTFHTDTLNSASDWLTCQKLDSVVSTSSGNCFLPARIPNTTTWVRIATRSKMDGHVKVNAHLNANGPQSKQIVIFFKDQPYTIVDNH